MTEPDSRHFGGAQPRPTPHHRLLAKLRLFKDSLPDRFCLEYSYVCGALGRSPFSVRGNPI
jgi:hypothetical protein